MGFDEISGLNDLQADALHELKQQILSEKKISDWLDDSMYLRFLRARNYDVTKAEIMLRNHIDWRKKSGIDQIAEFKCAKVVKYVPFERVGFDKEGCVIRIISYGNMDGKGILKSITKNHASNIVYKYLESDVELLSKQSKKFGKQLDTWIYIIDFENASFAQIAHKPMIELIVSLFSVYEANYPERLKSAIIINASIYFTFIFSIVKPLLTGNTLSKIKIFGKTGYQEELLKMIHPDELPAYLGGNRTDQDGNPRCLSSIRQGGTVPKSYYFRSQERRLANQPGVKKLLVSRMSKLDIPMDIEEAGSQITWEFETENRDISFGLYFQDLVRDHLEEVVPKRRVEAFRHCETGEHQCREAGKYILVFDNSYSWLSQKEVYCKLDVVSPGGEMTNALD